MNRWRVSLAFGMVALLFAAGCGNSSRDRPSDCTEFEFFNERNKQCTSCPAVNPPDCPEGCGYEIYELDNGCRGARCAPNCELCGVGRQYSDDKGLCVACPEVPDCSQFSCDGTLRTEGDYRAPCPPPSAYACGACTNPEDGCVADDQGACVDPSE